MNATIQHGARGHSNRVRGRISALFSVTLALLVTGAPAAAVQTTNAIPDNTISSGSIPGPAMADPEPPKIFGSVSAVAKGLRRPDGIARDTESGDIYVSEKDAATIVRIKPNGSRQVVFDSATPLYEDKGYSRKKIAGLRSPEGLALDGKGTLYVAEGIPGGRVISFNFRELASNPRMGGRMVPIPVENNRFAWESVDARPSGELLVAGSTMESFLGEPEKERLSRGAILYRDAKSRWWMPLNDVMVSYSAVCFSADGHYAFFACEVPGEVGCLDLESHKVRTFRSEQIFQSPKGLCALPGGSALVAEEAGKIYRLDPTADKIQLLYGHKRTIESISWDDPQHRLLVTDDQPGTLWSLELKADADVDFRSLIGSIRDIPFKERSAPVGIIPDQCPNYLAKILKLGGFEPRQMGGNLALRDLVKEYCLVAIDAVAKPLPSSPAGEDPIQRIQFVIMASYSIGVQEGELIWSASGFTAVKESGQTVKTELVPLPKYHDDILDSRFISMDGKKIALPFPISARINADGVASIYFMGLGVTPDYLLTLDTVNPDQSVMEVMQPDGKPQRYSIDLPPNQDSSYWVVAVNRPEPEVWRNMSSK